MQEYDWTEEDINLSQSQRLAKQRKDLKLRLGLGGPVEQLMDTQDLIKDEDLVAAAPGPKLGRQQSQKEASALILEMTGACLTSPIASCIALAVCLYKRSAYGVWHTLPSSLLQPDKKVHILAEDASALICLHSFR